MIEPRDVDRIRDRLLDLVAEDAHNSRRIAARLDSITEESGIDAYAAMLLVLTRLSFEADEARRHWEAILAHRDDLSRELGRNAGLRTAILDYFTNVNRRLTDPLLIDLELHEGEAPDPDEDRLTGLVSDRRFRSDLQAEIRRARRYGLQTAVVVADLDSFATVNERFGPLLGDRMLRELAVLAGDQVRDIDSVARPGGDEIVLLLPETGRNGALLVAERVRRAVESHFARRVCRGEAVGLTISAGVACYPEDATTPETLLEHAAQALYHAKAAGRNTVHLYHADRRRYVRFDLEPGRFEIEVFAPSDRSKGKGLNLSRNGILFTSPERIEVGEPLELRVMDAERDADARTLRLRGQVVRLEELPAPDGSREGPPLDGADDRYEIGVALDLEWSEGTNDLIAFLEHAQGRRVEDR